MKKFYEIVLSIDFKTLFATLATFLSFIIRFLFKDKNNLFISKNKVLDYNLKLKENNFDKTIRDKEDENVHIWGVRLNQQSGEKLKALYLSLDDNFTTEDFQKLIRFGYLSFNKAISINIGRDNKMSYIIDNIFLYGMLLIMLPILVYFMIDSILSEEYVNSLVYLVLILFIFYPLVLLSNSIKIYRTAIRLKKEIGK